VITIITDSNEITSLHERFHHYLNNFLTENIRCWVGYPSGSFEDTVRYSPELDIWISHDEHKTKFWNGFGIGKPIEGKNNSLNGEINFPYEGIYRRIGGVFAAEDNGNILVLHRGTIGGGRAGVGKHYFTNNFRGDFVNAIDGNKETEFCLVGELNSPHFPKQVANFIKEIYRVKYLDSNQAMTDFGELTDFNYTSEHSGRTVTERNDPIVIDRTHGIVVNALAEELQQRGYKVGNDRNRDLFIHKENKITTLFEIKTSSSTQCLYSAVGQLIIYSIPIRSHANLIAVLPDELNKKVVARLSSLGIKLLYYQWDNDRPIFSGLDKLFN
jgi:hypothetical protein